MSRSSERFSSKNFSAFDLWIIMQMSKFSMKYWMMIICQSCLYTAIGKSHFVSNCWHYWFSCQRTIQVSSSQTKTLMFRLSRKLIVINLSSLIILLIFELQLFMQIHLQYIIIIDRIISESVSRWEQNENRTRREPDEEELELIMMKVFELFCFRNAYFVTETICFLLLLRRQMLA